MNGTKYLKGVCGHCGGHIEFPAEATGMPADCPHCGKSTELMLAAPAVEPAISRKTIFWTSISLVILLGGLGLAFVALKSAQRWAARREAPLAPTTQTNPVPVPEDPITKAGFHVTEAKLQKVEGSKLVYAVGEILNTSDRQRFGVRVELDLFDGAGKKVGTAKDYVAVLEARGRWEFRALVMEGKASSVKLAGIKEDQ